MLRSPRAGAVQSLPRNDLPAITGFAITLPVNRKFAYFAFAAAAMSATFPISASAGDWERDLAVAPQSTSSPAPSGLHFGFDPMNFLASRAPEGGAPLGNARFLHRFSSDFDSLPGGISSNEFSAFAPILPLSAGSWRFATFASYRAIDFNATSSSLVPDGTVHSFQIPSALIYEISDRWIVGAFGMFGWSGDYKNMGDSFSYILALGAGYRFNETFKLIFGGAYGNGFNDEWLYPGVGFLWNPNDQWSATLLPPFASVSYRFGDDWIFSLVGRYDAPHL